MIMLVLGTQPPFFIAGFGHFEQWHEEIGVSFAVSVGLGLWQIGVGNEYEYE
jgi:hypothetical protein